MFCILGNIVRNFLNFTHFSPWLILNFLFFSSSLFLGMVTGLPISPGIPLFFGTTRAFKVAIQIVEFCYILYLSIISL